MSCHHQIWSECVLAKYVGQVRLLAISLHSLESHCPLIIEIPSNWSCPINNFWSFYPIITKFSQSVYGHNISDKCYNKAISLLVIVFDHHQFRQYYMLMGRISWSGSITKHVKLSHSTHIILNGQNYINNVCSLNLPDVQPIITILGLKNIGRAYFVTFGALVVFFSKCWCIYPKTYKHIWYVN